jgi:hypothetical protein
MLERSRKKIAEGWREYFVCECKHEGIAKEGMDSIRAKELHEYISSRFAFILSPLSLLSLETKKRWVTPASMPFSQSVQIGSQREK